MLRFKHSTLVSIAGALWMIMGIFLMNMGLRLIAEKSVIVGFTDETSLLKTLSNVFGGLQQAAVALIGLGLMIGYMKGRFVLAKTVAKMVARLKSFEEPVSLYRLYSPKFYLLILIMISMGALFRIFEVPSDIRGLIDLAVGAALINGAVLYFKYAKVVKSKESVS
jgi:hypothetical protein